MDLQIFLEVTKVTSAESKTEINPESSIIQVGDSTLIFSKSNSLKYSQKQKDKILNEWSKFDQQKSEYNKIIGKVQSSENLKSEVSENTMQVITGT